jgi:uncharacterized protein
MRTTAEPTARDERIGMLDTTRGVAVLGILLMNITAFGLPNAYDDPTNWGGYEGLNFTVWRTMALWFEGTMRGLFTLLFGAGALLFLQRHTARSPDLRAADLYYRRTMWLIVFGLVNGYLLLWSGDVLYCYGVVGLLLFVFRNLSARRLIIAAAVIMILQTLVTVVEWQGYHAMRDEAAAAQTAKTAGQTLTADQQEAIDTFDALSREFKPPLEYLEQKVESVREGYLGAMGVYAPETWHMQTSFFFRHMLLEGLGMMLLGMALLKSGVLTGAATTRVYALMLVIGYAMGLMVNWFETTRLAGSGFTTQALIESYLTYDLGRIPMTFGHIGLLGLLCRAAAFAPAARMFGAVGQMALTNYLSQSVICLLIFTGAGLGLYGALERYELYFVVFGIWALQLVWSPLWLRYFRFGPTEWAWRSLTYWRIQPMRQATARETVVPA